MSNDLSDENSNLIGKRFGNFNELSKCIEKYQEEKNVQFFIKDSRTVQSAQKRVKRFLFEDLKYYQLMYACIHGGKEYKHHSSKGTRPNQSTMKMSCEASITVSASDCGHFLVIKSINEKHNHHISKAAFRHLPQQRRLDESQKEEVKKMINLGVNKKLLQNSISENYDKQVCLRDLHNIAHCSKKDRNLESICQVLSSEPGTVLNILTNEASDTVKGILYQSHVMKSMMKGFPEVLFIDATYRTNNIGMAMYVLLIEDGNGASEIVGIWLLADESKATIKQATSSFIFNNSEACKSVKVVISDKDFTERAVFNELFPNAKQQICLFHTLRSFRREVTTEKLRITEENRISALDFIQKLAYACDETTYSRIYDDFVVSLPNSIISYYNRNWHDIRDEWVEGLKTSSLGNSTNNRLESINQKIKSVIPKNATFSNCIMSLKKIITTLRIERDLKALNVVLKRKVVLNTTNIDETKYAEYLTPFAFQMIIKQLNNKDVGVISQLDQDNYEITSNASSIQANSTNCSCPFFLNLSLPCKHIFAVRKLKNVSLFCSRLCAVRWTKSYYVTNHQIFIPTSDEPQPSTSSVHSIHTEKRRLLSQGQKFQKAMSVAQIIATLVSDVGMREYENRMKQLEFVIAAWKRMDILLIDTLQVVEPDTVQVVEPDTLQVVESDIVQVVETDTLQVVESDIVQVVETDTLQVVESDIVQVVEPDTLQVVESDIVQVVETDTLQVVESDIVQVVETETVDVVESDIVQVVEPETVDVVEHSDQPSTSHWANQPQFQHDISKLCLPQNIRRRGRPKGADKTVIGLPKSKKRKLLPFDKLSLAEQKRVKLLWITDANTADRALSAGYRLSQEDLLQNINPGIRESSSEDLEDIMRHCLPSAWRQVKLTLAKLRGKDKWFCGACHKDLDINIRSIGCDRCLSWSHFSCQRINEAPRDSFFCNTCKRNS